MYIYVYFPFLEWLGYSRVDRGLIIARISNISSVIIESAKGPPVQRKPLKHRDYEVDLSSRLGKTQVSCTVSFCDRI